MKELTDAEAIAQARALTGEDRAEMVAAVRAELMTDQGLRALAMGSALLAVLADAGLINKEAVIALAKSTHAAYVDSIVASLLGEKQ